MAIYVVGHKNPDTDSIVSAIAYSKINNEYIPARAGELNKETKFVLEKFGFEEPVLMPNEEKQVILVDNNGNPEELAEGVRLEEIIEVIDHHKLAGLKTSEPISFLVRPIGSTATIVKEVLEQRGVEISKNLAGALICAILSDTLRFNSPTTTAVDRKTIEELVRVAEVGLEELADSLFAAKSDISDLKTEELISKDSKVFQMGEKRVAIGVWETVLPEKISERKEDIIKELQAKKKNDDLDLVFFFGVDILRKKSDLYLAGEDERVVAEGIFAVNAAEGVLELPGVVSRKKQMTPLIEKYLTK